jgi:hypothetical protein
MADREHPDTRRELSRHINHFLFGGDQPLGKEPSQTVSTLNRPPTLRKTPRPPLRRLQASAIRPKLRALQQFAVLIQDSDSIGRLVRIDADQYLHSYLPLSSHYLLLRVEGIPTLGMKLEGFERTSVEPHHHGGHRSGAGLIRASPQSGRQVTTPSVPPDALETRWLQTARSLSVN